MKNIEYNFSVESLESGQRKAYGDSYYSYKVTSNRNESDIKAFCTKVLRPSYPKSEMPDPFAGELLEFKRLTDNNKDRTIYDERKDETYSYKLRTEYTG